MVYFLCTVSIFKLVLIILCSLTVAIWALDEEVPASISETNSGKHHHSHQRQFTAGCKPNIYSATVLLSASSAIPQI